MNRAQRRAAERLSLKAAAASQLAAIAIAPVISEEPVAALPSPKREISAAKLEANRQNAQHSTGPASPEAKAKVSANAVKTALTGRTILLPFDDAEAYRDLLLAYQKEFQPVGPVETGLVQSIVDTVWRLERIPGLEYALVEEGYNSIGHANPELALKTPDATLELHIRLMNEKPLRNLHLQENRLVRRREKELKELRALQQTRKDQEAEALNHASQVALLAKHRNQPFVPAEFGFEFSTQQINAHLSKLSPAVQQNLLKEGLARTPETTQIAA